MKTKTTKSETDIPHVVKHGAAYPWAGHDVGLFLLARRPERER